MTASDSRAARRARARLEAKARSQQRRGHVGSAFGFVVRFAAGWLLAAVVIAALPQIDELAIRGTVWSLGALLALLPIPSETTGPIVTAGTVSFQIVPDCTPLMPTAVLWSAVLAFPASWRSRTLGLLLGAAALWVYNLARILALVAVRTWWPAGFELIHVYLWQTTTLVAVVAIFLIWLRRQAAAGPVPPREPAISPAMSR